MIEVLFFARLREQLGTSRLEFSPAHLPTTVQSLIQELRARGADWDAALSAENILCAVNQHQAPGLVVRVQHGQDAPVAAGDEVAFFPPVTGG